MKVHNFIPLLQECVTRWHIRPTRAQFETEYANILNPDTGDFFEDFYEVLGRMNWPTYRALALALDAAGLEARLHGHIAAVESLLGVKLKGDVCLLGTFGTIDGYARFDCGSHRVFLGMDQYFDSEEARDLLMVHELTHVARESSPTVWTGWGLNPVMTQDEFTESQPVIEHLMGEGFSCLVSEILVPGQPPECYAYQSPKSMHAIQKNAAYFDQFIHREIKARDGDYGNLYGLSPIFSHYVWAWQWVKSLYENQFSKNAQAMVAICSKDWVENALQFELKGREIN